MSGSFAYLSLHKNSFARVKNEKGKRKERERTLTIVTGYSGVQTFPTRQLFISEREVGVGKARKEDEGRGN